MDNEAIQQPTAAQPDPRIQLAFERTFLAYERTGIAWGANSAVTDFVRIRHCKVFSVLREKQGETATVLSPRAIGLAMITIGLVGLILASWQDRGAVKALRERCPDLPTSVSGVMVVLIAMVGVLALIGALLR